MQMVASQRDQQLRQQFAIDVSLYEANMLVFVDETGVDRRDSLRKYGYSIRGKPQQSRQCFTRGERISVIAAMNTKGILALKVVRGTVDGNEFIDFVQGHLVPALLPFNGVNPNSIVLMDNCSVHHVAGAASTITQAGALVHFLPPYSPDLNPIEECFSKVKSQLKRMNHDDDLETNILSAFSSITEKYCIGWISDSKVYK